MLSIQPLKSAQGAADYYLSTFNYYAGDALAMQWLGKGSAMLQLKGAVEKEQMLALLEGKLPNGEILKNAKGEHRPGFDMTFSAPKSVSVLVGLGAAPELIAFHDKAVAFAMGQIEAEFAEARLSRAGEVSYEKTGNFVVAAFRQPSSRANDPALHTHCVTLNMTFLEGKAKSLASDISRNHGVVEQIQNNTHYCGLLYRHHLANQLKEAGYLIRLTGDGLFELEGVPPEVLSEFSRRREDIERLMDEKGWQGAKSASNATLLTRQGKEEHDLAILQADWQERAHSLGFDAKAFVQNRHALTPAVSWFSAVKERFLSLVSRAKQNPETKELAAARACIEVAIETLSQRASVFTERALKAESLKQSFAVDEVISQKTILDAIKHEKKTQTLYEGKCHDTGQTLLTTPWLLTLETETLARIENNKGVVVPIASAQAVHAFQKERAPALSFPMNPSQQEAMRALLTSKDRYLAIQGYAGVAKTTMLAEARLFMEQQGFQLRGITVASAAANELQMKAGICSDVFPLVHQELKESPNASLRNVVFIVDEASMLSSPQGHALMKHIERTQARLVLVGDKAQLPSVKTGRIFSLAQDYGIATSVMNEIVRQKNHSLKEAVLHATQGEVSQALEKLDVKEFVSHEERIQWIAQTWLNLTLTRREETLLFAPTHTNREAITTLIREGLKQEGSLGGLTVEHATLKAKTIEAVQQRFIAYYQKDDVVRFNQDFKKQGIKRDDYYKVGFITPIHRRDNVLPLIDNSGKTLLFALKNLPHYKTHTAPFERMIELYQPKSLELQVGDKVMWTRNFKADGIRNGQCATLHEITEKHLQFKTKEGDLLTFDKSHSALQHLDYSYVLTNYKVQGKDAPYGIGLMESYHRFSATLKNFYVQISRAIHGMTLVTDNKAHLVKAIERNPDKKMASLDVLSSAQLAQHETRFANQARMSLQTVIDKKLDFEGSEKSSPFKPDNKINELSFTKSNYQKIPQELIKELEL